MLFLFAMGCTFPSHSAQTKNQMDFPHAEIVAETNEENKVPAWIRNYALIPQESVLFSPTVSAESNAKQFSLRSLLSESKLTRFYQEQAKKNGFTELMDLQAQEGHLLQYSRNIKQANKKMKEVLSIEIVSLPYTEHNVVRLGYSLAEYPTN